MDLWDLPTQDEPIVLTYRSQGVRQSHGKSVRHSTVDEKGRLLIPDAIRKQLGIEAGDIFFVQVEDDSGVLRYARAENPFDLLAEHAIREHRAGRTRGLRDIAHEEGIDLDSE